jgi:hypothetical protein
MSPTYQTSIPNGSLGYLLKRMATYLDWAPTSAPETEARFINLVNDELARLSTESPWLINDKEFVLQVESDFIPSDHEDDVVLRHEHDPFVLTRTSSEDFDDWPTDGSWNSRWIEITNEAGDVERRRIRSVWRTAQPPAADTLYMSVDRALTITGETLDFRVFTIEYPLPHGTVGLSRDTLIQDNRLDLPAQRVQPMKKMTDIAFRGGDREIPEDYAVDWYCGAEVQPLATPAGAPGVAKTAGQSPTMWSGPDLPGTFQYCVAYGWGQYADTSEQDEAATLRPIPKYLSAPSEASASVTVAAGGNAVEIYLPDVAWLAGWGESALTTSTSDVRWYHTGIYRYVFRRRLATTAPVAPPHNNANMQRHVPADGVWRLWRVVQSETTQTLTDNGALPLEMQQRPLTTDGRHLTLLPNGAPTGAKEVYLRLRVRPPPLFGASDPLGLVPGAEIAVAMRAAARFASSQSRHDVSQGLMREAGKIIDALRGNSTGVGSRITRRIPSRRY